MKGANILLSHLHSLTKRWLLAWFDAQPCICCTAVAVGWQGDAFCASTVFIIASRQELSPSHLDGVIMDFIFAEGDRRILQIC